MKKEILYMQSLLQQDKHGQRLLGLSETLRRVFDSCFASWREHFCAVLNMWIATLFLQFFGKESCPQTCFYLIVIIVMN